MIHYIDIGNIFELEGITNYAHGCNCSGAMGKGIAVLFMASIAASIKGTPAELLQQLLYKDILA
ncbi:hypothetical protein [Flectobacillus major]|uniref:hypothetical protein n=1 Tax=Flectobacillus major TaxID=103 RepID=UPI000425D56F|nr:hypothetical protein [Flectobacillus major]